MSVCVRLSLWPSIPERMLSFPLSEEHHGASVTSYPFRSASDAHLALATTHLGEPAGSGTVSVAWIDGTKHCRGAVQASGPC